MATKRQNVLITGASSGLGAEMARGTLDKLEQSRAWIETAPALEAAA